MNFGGTGFPFPQDNGIGQNKDSWTPVTPGKPIPPRSDMIPVDMQGNQVSRENWNDLLGVYSDILEAPDLNVVATGHISNPSGAMGTNAGMSQSGRNMNSNLVLSQSGGVRNGNLVLSQNGGIPNGNMVFGQNGGAQSVNMGQIGGVRNVNVGTRQNLGVQNVNVGMGQNRGVRNVDLGMGYNGGVQNMYAGMVQNGGNQSRNVGAGQNAQIHDWRGQGEGNYDWSVGLGQYGGNHNMNMGTVQIGGNRNPNMAMSQNGGNHNQNVGLGQTGMNRTQRITTQNGYSSSYTTRTLPNDPSNWSPGLLAALLKAKNQATASGPAMTRAMQTSFQVQSRPVIPSSGSNWPGSEFPNSGLREQDQMFGLSQDVRGYDLQQLPIDGYQDTYRLTYNLNSPPRAEAEATSTSIANFFQLEPVTPDKGKLQENHQVPQEVNCSVDGSSRQEKDSQEQLVILTSEKNENHCNELLQSIVNSSSSAIVNSSSSAVSTTLILDAFEEGHERGIDLNKTPQQKTPKRKKHRPKVVREGKSKKTANPKAPEKGVPSETPPGKRKTRKNGLKISESQQPNGVGQVCAESPQGVRKRKYVRKNNLKTPESQQEIAVDFVKVPAAEQTSKSCRRALSFDLESTQNDENQVERNQGSIVGFNLNINPQDTELCTGVNSISKASAEQLGGQNGYIAGPKDPQTSTYQMQLRNSSLAKETAPATPLTKMKAHALNAIARNVTMRNSISGQNAQLNGYSQVDQHASTGLGLGQGAFNSDAGCTNIDRVSEKMLQSTSQLFMEDMPSVDGKRGLKRHSIEQMNPHTINNTRPPFMYQKMLQEAIRSSNVSDHFDSSCLESNKKKKMQNGDYSNNSTSPSGITAVNGSPGQERRGINSVQANSSVTQLLNTYFRGEATPDKVTNAVNLTTGNNFFHPMSANQNLQKHHIGSELQSCAGRLAMKRSQELNRVHDINPLTAIVACNLPTTQPNDTARADYLRKMRARNAYLLQQQQTLKQSSSNRQFHVSDQNLQREYNNAVEGHRHLPTAPKETPRSDYLQDIRTSQANVLEQKQGQNPISGNRRGIDKMLQQQQKFAEGHQKVPTKARGVPKKQNYLGLVDEITYRLEGLNISSDQHALVPYNADNSIVLFEPKKRKPRPRVDLDPETDRLWKLLMGKEGSEGAEAMDKDKEKWWEEERAVFRGRADSFIARMHLVQGDRRFSRWKGSVVDSVIGVFLTQNVSDHLSSSAFMSLAAKFPLNPTVTNEACCQSGIQVLVEEPDIQILEKNNSIICNERIGRQPLYNHNSIIACESIENKRHLSSGVSDAGNKHNRLTEEELVSQDSFDSVVFQTADEQRSSSGSNSEAEDQTTGSKPINPGSTLMNLLNPERGSLIQEFYNHINGSTMPEERATNMHRQLEIQDCDRQNLRFVGDNNLKNAPAISSSINSNIHHMRELVDSTNPFQLRMTPGSQKMGAHLGAMSAEESLSSRPSTASGVTGAHHTNSRTYHQNKIQTPQAQTFVKYGFLSKHPTLQGAFQPGHQIGSVPNSMNNQQPQNSNTHQVERAFMIAPIDPAETTNKRENDTRKQGFINPKFRGTNINAEDRMSVMDKQNCIENTAVEANSKEQTCSSREPLGDTATNYMKTKMGKAEDEKKRAFDWDSLRKQVLLNGGKKKRSKDAADSLNYEALRTTDVKNISDAIRERGMNNMLADRIQDFLNRLVRDHESIDLEWLRDVPPDKAKDYLLSFRGLGLKSVECVRLLTLHHLAFPVDTNVGRIAVRLGWVPLQPLPESLQLHLLEMYPVLESIQKYLWPRLCKLDQRTLYELHYQMITFGKVFCTKSKPNCNACPMRAECRHFASAFASARFALPGPEEKRMVSSAIPIVDDGKPKEGIKPLSLPPAENNSDKDSGFFARKSVSIIDEPIIEYPSSPHSETTELSERDIEDAFYEDPEEIPTIRLNMEEFTTNLQNLMQDNLELQGDMSKALVALNPEAASIPTAKLKNVSRLRTEHRVYELPDSHPLLDGLDKREPDDPSPYLLAIWTPGETANSVQPPESTCSARESGSLCDDNTCFSCNSTREANSQTVRGTILVPCRTAMRGSFPLNGTYFQVNEMFADHESSLRPIDVPRTWLWNLPRRTVFFGTSVSTIFKGLTTEEIQFCFWRGFVCVRGFDQKSRAPRPLMARLHFPASKFVKKKDEKK